MRSAYRRSSFAFASVVVTRPLRIREVTMLRNMAWRCVLLRPSLRPVLRCLTSFSRSAACPYPVYLLRGSRVHCDLARDVHCDLSRQLALEELALESVRVL